MPRAWSRCRPGGGLAPSRRCPRAPKSLSEDTGGRNVRENENAIEGTDGCFSKPSPHGDSVEVVSLLATGSANESSLGLTEFSAAQKGGAKGGISLAHVVRPGKVHFSRRTSTVVPGLPRRLDDLIVN